MGWKGLLSIVNEMTSADMKTWTKKNHKKQQSRFDSAAINFKGESKVGQLNSCNDND